MHLVCAGDRASGRCMEGRSTGPAFSNHSAAGWQEVVGEPVSQRVPHLWARPTESRRWVARCSNVSLPPAAWMQFHLGHWCSIRFILKCTKLVRRNGIRQAAAGVNWGQKWKCVVRLQSYIFCMNTLQCATKWMSNIWTLGKDWQKCSRTTARFVCKDSLTHTFKNKKGKQITAALVWETNTKIQFKRWSVILKCNAWTFTFKSQ